MIMQVAAHLSPGFNSFMQGMNDEDTALRQTRLLFLLARTEYAKKMNRTQKRGFFVCRFIKKVTDNLQKKTRCFLECY